MAHRASPLHFVERLPAVCWPAEVPPRGARIRERGVRRPPTDVTADTRADLAGSGARGKQVPVSAPPVTSDIPHVQQVQPPNLTLGMEQIVSVYSPPWAEPLPVTTIIPTKFTAIDVLNELLADPIYANSTWYTDRSLLAGRAGGAAVLVIGGVVHKRILIPLGDGQVAEGEIEGLVRATERVLGYHISHILIVSDSQAGLKGILSTAPRAGQFRAIQYNILVCSAMEKLPGLRITNLWTPAHIGTKGNELADDAAKAATLLPPALSVPVSLTTCKHAINTLISTDGGPCGRLQRRVAVYGKLMILHLRSSSVHHTRRLPLGLISPYCLS
ncbi:hypothetical protein B0H17DRAFT_1209542 [Mycena rosella]|uniref:RNase H type-1 domain-containing protein n=1 Tax=Mycena rosella TaxID=1033263 RepID=A0AAD7G9H5_MYCRO|nr:hypothetical protein B0H17DRAFT_1209542 [Mycena rosella]